MTVNKGNSDNQISFLHEIFRKATHTCALVIPGGYYFLRLSRGEMLAIMIPITIAMILIDVSRLRQWRFWTSFARKIGGAIIRQHEIEGDFTGASYILISVCLTVALFEKPIAIAALVFIIVGDTLAALVGRPYGRHRFFRGKSVEGSLACLAGTFLVSMILPGISLWVGAVGAVIATVVEAFSFNVDDNISVPLLSGLSMTLTDRVITFL
ncbi:MAG: phosphatidate cytidylyltransferase [Candidatus Zixiibacteriota bacterium]|nr:MAG: phosphatidate cytidylyltransferase [candidate division Zixibacteria bacterium]